MAIEKKASTGYLNTPISNTCTFSHVHAAGSDGHLFIPFIAETGKTISSVTYNDVSATLVTSLAMGATSNLTMYIYQLDAPSVGTYDVDINFGVSISSQVWAWAISFIGCSGVGEYDMNNIGSSPNQHTYTSIEENSYIIVGTFDNGVTATGNLECPVGTVLSKDYTGNLTAKGHCAVAFNDGGDSGAVQVEANGFAGGTTSLFTFEALEASGGGGPQGNMMLCF